MDRSLSEKYALTTSSEWRSVVRHFEWNAAFSIVTIIVPDSVGAQICREALITELTKSGKNLLIVPLDSSEKLAHLYDWMIGLKPDGAGAIWIEAAIPEAARDFEDWKKAWWRAFGSLNTVRNFLAEQFPIPFVFCGAPWIVQVMRDAAPDLWSVRSVIAYIEPGLDLAHMISYSQDSRSPKPGSRNAAFFLKQAEELRKLPGREALLAEMLYEAGKRFGEEYSTQESIDCLTEALALQRNLNGGESNQMLTRTLLALGKSEGWGMGYSQAVDHLEEGIARAKAMSLTLEIATGLDELGDISLLRSNHDKARDFYKEALPLYKQAGSVSGQANCFQGLGNIALQHDTLDEARACYQEALSLYLRVGDVLGQANCTFSFGEIALRRSNYDEARLRYQDALSLYLLVGDVLGQANCIRSLGDIALRLDDNNGEALDRYQEALYLCEQVGDVLGRANCIRSLGDIALRSLNQSEARSRYQEALPLYRHVGGLLGEANCLQGIGVVDLIEGKTSEARTNVQKALDLFEQIPEPYSMGHAHTRLARIAETPSEKQEHIAAARAAWLSIGRDDLLPQLDGL